MNPCFVAFLMWGPGTRAPLSIPSWKQPPKWSNHWSHENHHLQMKRFSTIKFSWWLVCLFHPFHTNKRTGRGKKGFQLARLKRLTANVENQIGRKKILGRSAPDLIIAVLLARIILKIQSISITNLSPFLESFTNPFKFIYSFIWRFWIQYLLPSLVCLKFWFNEKLYNMQV